MNFTQSIIRAFVLPAILFFAILCTFGQGPSTSTTSHLCSGETVTRVHTKTAKTPRLLSNVAHIWGGNRGVRGATRFDRWSSKRKRINRKFIVR